MVLLVLLVAGPSGLGLGSFVWGPATDVVGLVRPGTNFVGFSWRSVSFWPLWTRRGELRLGPRD